MQEPPARSPSRLHTFLTRRWPDLVGIGILVLLTFCYLSPALKDGPTFGPADLGRGLSLLTQTNPPTPIHDVVNGDTITQDIAWNTLSWNLVHHGELPLWNDLSGNGLPQLFNFESATFALPSLVGYLFPLSFSFLVTVAGKLLIAGMGTYLVLRLLGARPVAATFGGAAFMLSGAFTGWLGWAISGSFAWVGFCMAGVILCYRSARLRNLALLAISVAFAIYGGFPESDILLAGGLAVVAIVGGLAAARFTTAGRSPDLRGLLRCVEGAGLGLLLSAPLWLPGVGLLSGSARAGKQTATGQPFSTIVLAFTQGYDGLPYSYTSSPGATTCTPGDRLSCYFGWNNYFETAAYVGIAAIVLVVVIAWCRWRRPVVAGLVAGVVATALVTYRLPGNHDPVQALIRDVGLGAISVQRTRTVLAFFLALLAGLGLELVIQSWSNPKVRRALLGATGLIALVIAALWLHGAGPEDGLRDRSLWWPSATLVLLAAIGLLLGRAHLVPERHRSHLGQIVGGIVVALEGSFLVFAGVGINSYAPASYPATTATTTLGRLVGTNLVGFDQPYKPCPAEDAIAQFCGVRDPTGGIGYYPDMNLGYGLDELAVHDPVTPKFYFNSWPLPNDGQVSVQNYNVFEPPLTTAALARRYGVSYVLAAAGYKPTGMSPVATIRVATQPPEQLYAVPDSARFTLAGTGSVLSVRHPGDRTYQLSVRSSRPSELVAHVTDVAGWRVKVNGKSVTHSRVDGTFIGIPIGAGVSSVTLSYWPVNFTFGLVLALIGLLVLVATAVLPMLHKRAVRAG